jgi:predicted phage terminase large subunit-like protein
MIQEMKKAADNDFFYFCKFILNNNLMQEQPHREMCDFIVSENKLKKLINVPRGGFKSTVLSVGYSLWQITKNPNIRILLTCLSLDNAKEYLGEIKQHIEHNELFKALYGDLKPKDKGQWRAEDINVSSRTRVQGKEATVTVGGINQSKVGMHYDLIIMDDVLDGDTVNTSDQIQKTLRQYRLMLSILDPGCKLIIIGTRYHFYDLYGHIQEHEPNNYDILVKTCWDGPDGYWFPTRLTKEFLAEQKYAQGSTHFANQYENNPLSSDNAIFPPSVIKYYKEEELPKELRHYILTDAAVSLKDEADFTVAMVVAVDQFNNVYVRDPWRGKVVPSDFINIVFDRVVLYNVHMEGCVTLETNTMQQIYRHFFAAEMEKRKFFFPIHELKPNSTVSKERKIQGLQPWFERGKILIKEEHVDLMNEITRFPKSKHDDLVDALSGILEVMTPADHVEPDKWQELIRSGKLTANEVLVWKGLEEATSPKKRKVKRKKWKI